MSGIREDKHMGYIGFLLPMAGLAAAGGALDKGVSLASAASMTAAGAALMWLFEEDEDGEEEAGGTDPDGSSRVDKPDGEG